MAFRVILLLTTSYWAFSTADRQRGVGAVCVGLCGGTPWDGPRFLFSVTDAPTPAGRNAVWSQVLAASGRQADAWTLLSHLTQTVHRNHPGLLRYASTATVRPASGARA